MAAGLSAQERRALEEHRYWGKLAVKVLHPTQLLIVEAIWWVEEPLSATLLHGIYEGGVHSSLLSYHCRRLERLEVLEQVSEVPVRGVAEKFFDLAGASGLKRA